MRWAHSRSGSFESGQPVNVWSALACDFNFNDTKTRSSTRVAIDQQGGASAAALLLGLQHVDTASASSEGGKCTKTSKLPAGTNPRRA